MKLVLLVIATAACTTSSAPLAPDATTDVTPPDARSDFNASGTRIKLKYLETGDGAKVMTGVYDTLRAEDCAFRLAADGETRCMPEYRVATTGYFADAACTQPVLVAATCDPPPTYVAALGVVNCPSAPPSVGPVIYKRGATLSSAFRVNSLNNACVSTGSTPEITYYAIGAEVPETEFALATEKTEP